MKKYLTIISMVLCAMVYAGASTASTNHFSAKKEDIKFYAMGGGASGQRLYAYSTEYGLENRPTEMYNSNYITALAYDNENKILYAGGNTGYLGASVNGQLMQELSRVTSQINALYYDSSAHILWIAGRQVSDGLNGAVVYKYNVISRVLTLSLYDSNVAHFRRLVETNDAIYALGTTLEPLMPDPIYEYNKSSAQWAKIEVPNDMSSSTLTVDPITNVLYGASNNKVYARVSSSCGFSLTPSYMWVQVGGAFENQRVDSLIVDKSGKLYAATYGNGTASLSVYQDGNWHLVAPDIDAGSPIITWALAVGTDGSTLYIGGTGSSDGGDHFGGFLYEYNPNHTPSLKAIATNMDACSDPSRCNMRALAVPGATIKK